MRWGVAIVVVLCACEEKAKPRVAAEAPFVPKLAELLTVPATQIRCTYVRGKVVVLDEPTRKLDVAHILLPDDLRAKTPEEVGTVALVRKCERVATDGMFQDKASGKIVRGWQQTCTVAFVDRVRNALLDPIEVSGGTPLSGPAGQDLEGSRPQQDIADAIASVARIAPDAEGPSPVAFVEVVAPRRDPTHRRALDKQQAQLQAMIGKLVSERAGFVVAASPSNDGTHIYRLVPDVVEFKKTKAGVACRATVQLDNFADVDEARHTEPVADDCLQRAATELVDKAAARISGDLARASNVTCR